MELVPMDDKILDFLNSNTTCSTEDLLEFLEEQIESGEYTFEEAVEFLNDFAGSVRASTRERKK